jgi:hypothetical protein
MFPPQAPFFFALPLLTWLRLSPGGARLRRQMVAFRQMQLAGFGHGCRERTAVAAPAADNHEGASMGLLLAILLLIIVLAVLGFAVTKFLLIIAAIVLVLWLLGFVARGAEGARWYRW